VSEDFEERHWERLNACAAMEREFFVDPPTRRKEEANLALEKSIDVLATCDELAVSSAVDEEIELRTVFYLRLRNLWGLMISAGETRDEALSSATATTMKATLHTEFQRRKELFWQD
jgi:hypothetical protein